MMQKATYFIAGLYQRLNDKDSDTLYLNTLLIITFNVIFHLMQLIVWLKNKFYKALLLFTMNADSSPMGYRSTVSLKFFDISSVTQIISSATWLLLVMTWSHSCLYGSKYSL
jgi:hypothetical protein